MSFRNTAPARVPLNCKIFINNYELIEENIWFIYASVI